MRSQIRPLALLAALWTGAAAALAQETAIDFEVRYGNLLVSRMTLATNVEDDRYTARGLIRDAGLVGAFFDLTYDGTASGWIRGGDVVPRSYRAVSDDGNTRREVRIDYDAGRPVQVRMDPALSDRPYRLDPRQQAGALDPVSAAWRVLSDQPLEAACGRRIPVFDGRRRNRIEIGPPRGGPAEFACDGAFVRVAGYSDKAMQDGRRFPFTLHLKPAGDGQVRLERLEIQTVYGRLNAWRR